jgi:hypothetical protein
MTNAESRWPGFACWASARAVSASACPQIVAGNAASLSLAADASG